MTLLLSQESINKLDQSLINLNVKNVEFETLLENINHQNQHPEMYEKPVKNPQSTSEFQKMTSVLKEIKKNIKLSLIELSKQRSNLFKVHQIYISKFKHKMKNENQNLDETSRKTLMESLNMTQNQSINNGGSRLNKTKTNGNIQAKTSINEKQIALNNSFRSISEKTEELKTVLNQSNPDQRKAILKSIETKNNIAKKMYKNKFKKRKNKIETKSTIIYSKCQS